MSEKNNKRIPIINQSYMNQQKQQSLITQRKKKALIRRLAAFSILAAIVFITLFTTMYFQSKALAEKEEQLKQVKSEYVELEETQKVLEEEIKKLQDEEYIGKYARQEYFLSDEGEIIFTIPEDDNKTTD
jgi:cell division protein DivIC